MAQNKLNYARENIKHNSRLLIITELFMIIGIVISTISVVVASIPLNKINGSTGAFVMLLSLGIFLVSLSLFINILILPNTFFGYLHKKTQTDMVYSLPVKSTTRFYSDYFSGLLCLLVPYIVFGTIFLIVTICCCNITHEDSILKGVCSFTGISVAKSLIPSFFRSIVAIASAYTLCSLTAQFTGKSIDYYIVSLISFIAVPLALWFFTMGSNYSLNDYEFIAMNFIPYSTSPLGNLAFAVRSLDNEPSGFPVVLFYILALGVTVLNFFAAKYYHKIRLSEQVGKSVIYQLPYFVILTFMGMIFGYIYYTAASDLIFIIPVTIAAIITFVLLSLLLERGKIGKKSLQSLGIFAGSIVFFIVLLALISLTNCFGIEKYIPSKNNISSIEVNLSFEDDSYSFKNKKTIEKIRKYDIESHNKAKDAYKYNSVNNQIIYHTKTGFTIKRESDIIIPETAEIYNELRLTDEYINTTAKNLADKIRPAGSSRSYYYNPENNENNDCKIYLDISDAKLGYGKISSTINGTAKCNEFKSEIEAAVKADLKARTLQDYEDSNYIAKLYNYKIMERDTNILNIFEKYDVQIPMAEESIGEGVFSEYNVQSFHIIDPKDYYLGNSDNYFEEEDKQDDEGYLNFIDDGFLDFSKVKNKKFSFDSEKAKTKGFLSSNEYVNTDIIVRNEYKIQTVYAVSPEFIELYKSAKSFDISFDSGNNYYIMFDSNENSTFIPKNDTTEKLLKEAVMGSGGFIF